MVVESPFNCWRMRNGRIMADGRNKKWARTSPCKVIREKPLKKFENRYFTDFLKKTCQGVLLSTFSLRPSAIIRPLRIHQQLNGLSTTKIDRFRIQNIQKS